MSTPDIGAESGARDASLESLKSLVQLRAALDALPDPYAIVAALRDASGAVVDFTGVDANTAACRYIGYEQADVAGLRLTALLDPDVARGYITSFARVLASGEPLVIDRETVADGPDGEVHSYDARAARIDANHVAFTWRDVTELVEHARIRSALAAVEALADERARVARDLHDGAIQHVYATGMLLRAAATRAPAELRAELERIITAQDDIIGELRSTISGLLHPDIAQQPASVRLERTLDDAGRTLGFTPRVVVHGSLDDIDDPELLQHLLFAVAEMLSNIARHAAATTVDISIEVTPDHVTVEVHDNGVGPSGEPQADGEPGDETAGDETAGDSEGAAGAVGSSVSGGLGLANLRKRAELLGGTFELEPRSPTGTTARWTAQR
jgi:PAS domain S-box-containing protein